MSRGIDGWIPVQETEKTTPSYFGVDRSNKGRLDPERSFPVRRNGFFRRLYQCARCLPALLRNIWRDSQFVGTYSDD